MAKQRSKDNTTPDIGALENERRKLLVNRTNPKRLSEVLKILDYFYWGIE